MGQNDDRECAHPAMTGGCRPAFEDESFDSRDEPKVASPPPHSPSESQKEARRKQAEKRAFLEDSPIPRCELEQKQEHAGIARVGQNVRSNSGPASSVCSPSRHSCNVDFVDLYEDGMLEEATLGADILKHHLESTSSQEDVIEVYSSRDGQKSLRIDLSLLCLARSRENVKVPLVLTQADFDFSHSLLALLHQWLTPGKGARFAALDLTSLLKLIDFAQKHLLGKLEFDVTKAFIMKIVMRPIIPSPTTIANTFKCTKKGSIVAKFIRNWTYMLVEQLGFEAPNLSEQVCKHLSAELQAPFKRHKKHYHALQEHYASNPIEMPWQSGLLLISSSTSQTEPKKRSQAPTDAGQALKKQRIDDSTAKNKDGSMLKVVVGKEWPATGNEKLNLCRQQLASVGLQHRLRDPELRDLVLMLITRRQLEALLDFVNNPRRSRRDLQTMIRAASAAIRIQEDKTNYQKLKTELATLIPVSKLSPREFKQCYSAAMENADRKKMALLDGARVALVGRRTAQYCRDKYLEQQAELQSIPRRLLTQYAMNNAPEARRQVEKVVWFWQTEGAIEGLELDLRIADWRERTVKRGS